MNDGWASSDDGTYVPIWRRLTRGTCLRHERRDWSAFAGADWPYQIMNVEVTDRFHAKQGRSTGRLILQHGGRRLTVYLKRHYRLAWWRGMLATLWPGRGWSPAMEEWQHLEWARTKGMPVPVAVAAGEYIGPWGRLQSFLAVEELSGMVPLHEAVPAAARFLDRSAFRFWKRGLIREMARLARLMHERSYFHKDLYLCHFYIPESSWSSFHAKVSDADNWRGQVHLIDLHRLGRHPWAAYLWQVKDLGQLLYSSEIIGVNAQDRLWFWRCYLGPAYGTWHERLLRRFIVFKWQRYRRHNLKRKGLTAQSA